MNTTAAGRLKFTHPGTVHVPTKLILGVATTLVASVVLVTAVVAAAPVLAVVVVVLPDTTTGSVDGIGLPSLVCSFTT